ncbi:MAG: hypothetical protein BMS9Abin23_0074 [Thermodesulfobacteriota bacterium]|nr:MAG: hypothetical protein BMS9Abin23_0074 [Thermodesulfobacteriota bacterium]
MSKKSLWMITILTGLLWGAASLAPAPVTVFANDRDSKEIKESRDSDESPESAQPDDREYRFIIGVVNKNQVWGVIVNEGTRVRITSETEVLNSNEKKRSRYSIKEGAWLYVEGPLNYDGFVEAEKVYLLPGPVRSNEYGNYPFIKKAPIPWLK